LELLNELSWCQLPLEKWRKIPILLEIKVRIGIVFRLPKELEECRFANLASPLQDKGLTARGIFPLHEARVKDARNHVISRCCKFTTIFLPFLPFIML
jgi:hypothetical protein